MSCNCRLYFYRFIYFLGHAGAEFRPRKALCVKKELCVNFCTYVLRMCDFFVTLHRFDKGKAH